MSMDCKLQNEQQKNILDFHEEVGQGDLIFVLIDCCVLLKEKKHSNVYKHIYFIDFVRVFLQF